MAEEMSLPFRPFGFDTRTRKDCENTHPCMDYLDTFLIAINMKKFKTWLRDKSYDQLFTIPKEYWDLISTTYERQTVQDKKYPEKPSLKSGVDKFYRIIEQMEQRPSQIYEYYLDLYIFWEEDAFLDVLHLNEILLYLSHK